MSKWSRSLGRQRRRWGVRCALGVIMLQSAALAAMAVTSRPPLAGAAELLWARAHKPTIGVVLIALLGGMSLSGVALSWAWRTRGAVVASWAVFLTLCLWPLGDRFGPILRAAWWSTRHGS